MALLLVLWLGALPASIGATFSDPDYLITAWETEQGLPENSATAMVQTPDGYLWFGSFNGLVRFDGVKFTVFNPANTPSLPSSSIVNLHLDASRRLWVSTDRGLVVSGPDNWTRFQSEPGWTGNFVRTFSESAGVICMTSFDGKVFEVRQERFQELPEPPGEHGAGYKGCVDGSGRIWVGQDRFYGYWDGSQWRSSALAQVVTNDYVNLSRSRDGNQLIVLKNGILRINGESVVSRVEFPKVIPNAWRVDEDDEGVVWISSQGRLDIVQPSGTSRFLSRTNGLESNSIRFVFQDRERNHWVGTSGGGLLRLKKHTFQTFKETQGLLSRNIRCVVEEVPGRILIGSFEGGLNVLEEGRISLPEAGRQPFSRAVQCILADRNRNLWVGCYGNARTSGLTVITPTERRKFPAADVGGKVVNALFQDSLGRIWIGGDQAVAVFEDGRFTVQRPDDDLKLGDTRCFAEDPRNHSIWAGGDNGLYQFAAGRWIEVELPPGPKVKNLRCVRFSEDGSLWVGGTGVGLLRLADGRWTSWTQENGLPSNDIYSFIEDDLGYCWMGSNRGVIRILRADLLGSTGARLWNVNFQIYNLGDGLGSIEASPDGQSNVLKDSKGKLWFATLKGLSVVDPQRLVINTNPAPVLVETISYLDRNGSRVTVETGKPGLFGLRKDTVADEILQFPPGSSQLQADFSVLSFTAPEKVKLRYRLLQNQELILDDQRADRTITSEFLAPGEYELRVTAANNDGVWNEQGVNLAFVVQPFYWQTLWFRAFTVLTLGGAITLAVTRRQRSRLLQTEERLRQQQALAQERSRTSAFIQNSSDLITLMNREGRITYASPSISRITGYSPEDVTQRDAFQFVHPEDQVLARMKLLSVLDRSNPGIPFSYRFRHSKGHWIDLESLANNLLDDPAVNGILTITRDITDRKKAELALSESEGKFRALFAQSADANFLLENGIFLDCNTATLRLFGANREDIVGRGPDELSPETQPDSQSSKLKMLRHVEQALCEGSNRFEWTHRRLDGSSFEAEVVLTVIRLEGRPVLHASVRDISDRKKAETEKQALQTQLIQAQKMDAIGQLAGGVAHDFNNILTAVLMQLNLLEEDNSLSQEVREGLKELVLRQS